MLNKHFFRRLMVFVFIIALGLIGVALANYLDEAGRSGASAPSYID